MSITKNKELLMAGALLPTTAPVEEEAHVDTVSARTYQHPALGERCVVRLVPDTLAQGEDITFKTLGFEAPEVEGGVAKQQRRALGFPSWALVNDAKHAHFALDVMKDFRREAKRAATKPGHAKDGFEAIARQLSRSVPHFLPSFFEEAGRAFLEQGNTHYASQFFGKARDAEKAQGLAIDEQVRKAAFIEFALAGALSIKALTSYAKDLRESHDAAQAFEHFRELAVRRTLGGLPPWTGLAKEMRKLAKEAGLNVAQEDERLLGELLETSTIGKAPKAFWKDYEPTLASMSKANPSFRARLFTFIPDPPNDNERTFVGEWIALLDRMGTLADYDASPKGKELPPSGAWFSQLLKRSLSGWGRQGAPDALFALLRRLTLRIKAEGIPLDLVLGS
ncbi:MAG: hypothetical protein JRH20_21450, partial [Deltaproteobacteria bacterium]|nr:hypothetical protein [Deltaproteobacteria bacterium]